MITDTLKALERGACCRVWCEQAASDDKVGQTGQRLDQKQKANEKLKKEDEKIAHGGAEQFVRREEHDKSLPAQLVRAWFPNPLAA